MMPENRGSNFTSELAMPIKPAFVLMISVFISAPETEDKGIKVARPPSVDFKYEITALADCSFSTTIFWEAAPRAISMAVAYSSPDWISLDTGAMMPFSLPVSLCCITIFTLLV
ncbi:hypothetical protein SDC9_97795 [bioreactor metagenome]|uniref:Uncharacterized protein n=1 Tax=bioreactor metagenome TaxID=1076179 RepID=A0A645ACY8_9ZZZZ